MTTEPATANIGKNQYTKYSFIGPISISLNVPTLLTHHQWAMTSKEHRRDPRAVNRYN